MPHTPDTSTRLAWFSPMPPVRSGIAANSADLVRALAPDYDIDVFVDTPAPGARSAHDFLWLHRRQPYDLTVYQVGNSSHHNFLWPYLFRFPGLVVLHDVHLHHARAALLLTERRGAQYRAEFSANQPDASPDLAELAAAGFDTYLYYLWPMTRLVVAASRTVAVQSNGMWEQLRDELPDANVEMVRLTQGEEVAPDREARARSVVRSRYGLAPDSLIVGVFGGLTPEKRVPQILDAFAATLASAPAACLLLAGAAAPHYDVRADIRARGLSDRVAITGYLDTDEELTDAIAASDIVLNLRWPTAREVSGPWLRALAAGKATVTIDLAHLWDVPSLDPRTWTTNLAGIREPGSAARGGRDDREHRVGGPACDSGHRTVDPGSRSAAPVTVAVDILDEDHSLRLALRRLMTDASLRAALGAAGLRYWKQEHSPAASVAGYHRVITHALGRNAPRPALPPHLLDDGDRTLRALLEPFGPGVHFENSLEW